jgi:hypothetical protein
MLDYWNEESLCWASGRIQKLNEKSILIEDLKNKDVVEIKI